MAKTLSTKLQGSARKIADRVASAVFDLLATVPTTTERRARDPLGRARVIANAAAAKSALAAGGLALPPGPLGWLTIGPELVTIWKLQAQMVADIAAVFGKKSTLTREAMLYCLFRHAAAQAMRDLVVRTGQRVLVQQASLDALQKIATKIGVTVSHRVVGKGITRWVPLIGALGVGAYAYFDTGQVAKTAIELFQQELELRALPCEDVGD